jgi:hypothetical protein
MPDETPEHRHGHTPRSGDTHEIRKDGKLHNVDQAARDAADAPKRTKAAKKPSTKRRTVKRKAAAPSPAPAPSPTPSPAPPASGGAD